MARAKFVDNMLHVFKKKKQRKGEKGRIGRKRKEEKK